MADRKRIYNSNNPADIELVRNALLEDTSEDSEECLDESDIDDEEVIIEREGDSESEQSPDECDEDDGSDCYTSVEIKNKKVMNTWKWNKIPSQKTKRNILIHLPEVTGPARNLSDLLAVWKCLFTDEMMHDIQRYTNIYLKTIRGRYLRERDCRETDSLEIKALIGLLYLAGIYRVNRLNLEELWSMDAFRRVMSLKRFQFLMRCIRFDNIETRVVRKKIDRLAPIRDLFDTFVLNCQKCYSLGECVTIDEKLECFRGRCCFIQYMPKKPTKYGIKIYAMVDARTFYTHTMEIYAGEQPEGVYSVSNKPSDVVKRLAAPIFNSGRNITCDNWFTDFDLVNELAEKNLSFVGTIKKSKTQIPQAFKATTNRPQYTSIFGFRKEGTLVSYIPKSNRNIILLSSMHDDDAIDEGTVRQQPEILTFYNLTKGAVDTVDKLGTSYNVSRNTRRWPVVVFFSMLNVAGINAQIMFGANTQDNMLRRKYLRKLSDCLVAEHVERRTKTVVTGDREQVLKRNHPEEEDVVEETSRKRCRPCLSNKKTRLTRFKCEFCKKWICLDHSKKVCYECADLKSS